MRRDRSHLIWGAVLIVMGMLLLLRNLGLAEGVLAVGVWAVFAAAGLAFLYVFVKDKAKWWAAIPGLALLGLSILIGLDTIAPRLEDAIGGPLFLGMVGASFLVVYRVRRDSWWAVIPGGVLLTLALVALLDGLDTTIDTGGIFFVGLGLTFFVVSRLSGEKGALTWALIPGAILSIIGLLILAESVAILTYVWPAILILAGAYFVYRSLGRAPGE